MGSPLSVSAGHREACGSLARNGEQRVIKGRQFDFDEARQIGDSIGVDWNMFPVEQFRLGLGVEQEHGTGDPQTDVTHDDVRITGKIVWVHLRDIPDYYTRLAKMEKDASQHWSGERAPYRRGQGR
jgi:hypothetical protein